MAGDRRNVSGQEVDDPPTPRCGRFGTLRESAAGNRRGHQRPHRPGLFQPGVDLILRQIHFDQLLHERIAALRAHHLVGFVRMERRGEPIRIIAAHPAESDQIAVPVPRPESGAAAVKQQQILPGFAVALHRLRRGLLRNRQSAGIGDHVEDQQITLLRKIEGGETAPVVLEELHLRIIRRNHLVRVASRTGFVMVVCDKENHFTPASLRFTSRTRAHSGRHL